MSFKEWWKSFIDRKKRALAYRKKKKKFWKSLTKEEKKEIKEEVNMLRANKKDWGFLILVLLFWFIASLAVLFALWGLEFI